MMSLEQFWIQTRKDLDWREDHDRIVPTWLFLAILLIAAILIWNKLFVALNWFEKLLFVIALFSFYMVAKRDGYPEGYMDGSGDTRDRILEEK